MGRKTRDIHGSDGPPPELALAELAGKQWGVVSLQQLRWLGLTADAVEHRSRTGRLHRVYRGVYAVGHAHVGREGRSLAAVLACGPGAVLSHRSAAAHWGLLPTAQARVDVTAPRSREGRRGIHVHRSRFLDARDTTTHERIPTTTIPRTLLDLATTVRPDRLERALAQAERLRLYDHRALEDALTRSNGHRGTRILIAATAREPKLTRSEWEVRLLTLIRTTGLPEPDVNSSLDAPDHKPIEADFHWPAHHLIVETDGWDTHRTRAAFEDDRARDAALTAAGYRVVRFTWRTDDATLVRRLRALLA